MNEMEENSPWVPPVEVWRADGLPPSSEPYFQDPYFPDPYA